jgi:hypothetical protein
MIHDPVVENGSPALLWPRRAGLCYIEVERGELQMSAMPSPVQSEFSEGTLTIKPSGGLPTVDPDDRRNDGFPRRSFAKRAPLALARFLITFGVGVGAALAWQSYGDTAREMIANASPQLAWLALPAAPVAQDPVETIAPASPAGAPASPFPDQQFGAVSLDLDALRQGVDRIAANQDQMTRSIGQLVAGQEQMTREIAKLQSIEQYLLYRNSEPPPRPAAPAPRPAARPAQPPAAH